MMKLVRKISQALKNKYQTNPELKQIQGRPETRKKQSETSKKVWTEEKRKEHSEILKKLWKNNFKLREKQSQISKEMWKNPEHKKNLSEIGKKRWADPQLKSELSKLSQERWRNPEYRKKREATLKFKRIKNETNEIQALLCQK